MEAKRALSGWFRPLAYDKAAVAAALVEIFDRLYFRPLLSTRAFIRSGVVSVVVTTALFLAVLAASSDRDVIAASFRDHTVTVLSAWGVSLLANVGSDYVSLFVVRRWLLLAGQKPIRALLVGPLLGASVILLVFYLKAVLFSVIMVLVFQGVPLLEYSVSWPGLFGGAIRMLLDEVAGFSGNPFFWAAVAVHLWLPLFALGVLSMQALNWFFRATDWMQWVLEGGREHPLRAVGYVAAFTVFVVAAPAQLMVR